MSVLPVSSSACFLDWSCSCPNSFATFFENNLSVDKSVFSRMFFEARLLRRYILKNSHLTKNKQTMASPSEIATAFIQHYYQTLDANPDALAGLYVCLTIK
jgi:hypothetical protein